MEEPRQQNATEAMVERAEQMGARIGRLAALALRRVEMAARRSTSGGAVPTHAEAPDLEAPTAGPGGAAAQRAEALLDGVSDRIGELAAVTGPSIQKFAALAREEVEDIWAEAQHIRRSKRGDSG